MADVTIPYSVAESDREEYLSVVAKLQELTGHEVGHGKFYTSSEIVEKTLKKGTFQFSDIERLLRRWWVLQGVSENKAWRAGEVALANSWKAGPSYVRKVADDPDNRRRTSRGAVDIGDLTPRFIEGQVEPNPNPIDLLKETPKPSTPTEGSTTVLMTGSFPPLPARATPPRAEAPAPEAGRKIRLDEDQLARAADSVISPRIQQAKDELTRQFQAATRNITDQQTNHKKELIATVVNAVKEEVERAELGNKLTQQIEDLATRIIQQALPRSIDIKYGKINIHLPAEARHKAFDSILRRLIAGTHVYIVGPKGTGKTHLFQQLFDAMKGMGIYDSDEQFAPIGQSLTKYDLSGYKSPTGEYVGTLMRNALEFGYFVVIDEGDMWAAAALGFLNTALAGNGWVAFPDKVIKVHERFRCVLAANTIGGGATLEYQGRNPLDAASLDRFAFTTLDYDRDMEAQIYGLSPWLQYVWAVRDACARLKMNNMIPSMRAIAGGLKDYAIGIDPDDICDSWLWKGAAQDTIAKIKNLAGEPPRPRHPAEVPTENAA